MGVDRTLLSTVNWLYFEERNYVSEPATVDVVLEQSGDLGCLAVVLEQRVWISKFIFRKIENRATKKSYFLNVSTNIYHHMVPNVIIQYNIGPNFIISYPMIAIVITMDNPSY